MSSERVVPDLTGAQAAHRQQVLLEIVVVRVQAWKRLIVHGDMLHRVVRDFNKNN
jgi:hypothetical protein